MIGICSEVEGMGRGECSGSGGWGDGFRKLATELKPNTQ